MNAQRLRVLLAVVHRRVRASLLLLVSMVGGCASVDPTYLPTDLIIVGGIPDGFDWTRNAGVDFDVWKATSTTRRKMEVGVYVGSYPSYAKGSGRTSIGRFARQRVTWEFSANSLEANARLTYDPGRCYRKIEMHVW